jgi:organic hydroperoxide reductase OsmC/OhrA
MQPLPHRYHALARGTSHGPVVVGTEDAGEIETQAPPEFGGLPGHWSPETLLAASIADCYLLTFRACARGSRLEWLSLVVDVEGELDRDALGTRFTRVRLAPRLALPPGTSETLARAVLLQAKAQCVITNSLNAACELEAHLHMVANDEEPATV